MSKTYAPPILTKILNIFGVVLLIAGGLAIIAGTVHFQMVALEAGAAFVVAAIFCIGLGQVIDSLGKTAFHSERLADFVIDQGGGGIGAIIQQPAPQRAPAPVPDSIPQPPKAE